jgi:hypothetical protein
MNRAITAAAVASASCAQIAGIDETNGNARPIDSLVVTRRSIGTMPMDTLQDLTSLEATYFVAQAGTAAAFDRVTADPDGPGTWTTKLHEPAPVQFTLPDAPAPFPRLFAFPSHQLNVLYPLLEHPGYTPALDGAMFTVTGSLDVPAAATDSFQTYVVGAWLQRGFSAAEVAPAATAIGLTYGFTAANSVSDGTGAVVVERATGHAKPGQVTAQDAFLILRYGPNGLSGVAQPKAAVVQVEAVTAVDMDTMVPVVQDQMLMATIAPLSLQKRYDDNVPKFQASQLAMTWNLVAAPGYQAAINAGPGLRGGTLGPADIGITAAYGNPFAARGWNTMFVLVTSRSRVYTAAGTMASISLIAGMNQFLQPASSQMLDLKLPAGLPTMVALDGTAVSGDGQAVKPPTGFVHATFVTDLPGATLYHLEVWDLVPDPTVATALDRKLVFAAASDQASFMIPPEVFQVGHSYTLRALTTLGGFPGVATGDFITRELPMAQSYLDSPVITVTP